MILNPTTSPRTRGALFFLARRLELEASYKMLHLVGDKLQLRQA